MKHNVVHSPQWCHLPYLRAVVQKKRNSDDNWSRFLQTSCPSCHPTNTELQAMTLTRENHPPDSYFLDPLSDSGGMLLSFATTLNTEPIDNWTHAKIHHKVAV